MTPRMRDLYPPVRAARSGTLRVDATHTLYWEEAGRPDGTPAVYLHGGPGAGVAPDHRRFFDPDAYRIVLFDQRGAGRSTPLGETRANTTAHLVADIERLRAHLGIERWLVFGGSWGATLALAYAQAHPDRVRALVVRGIFLGRAHEIDWFLNGIRMVFPEVWQRFADFIPAAERGDLLTAYHRRLMDPDPSVHMPAARAWAGYEAACSTLLPSPDTVAAFTRDRLALALARLEAHYFANGAFLDERQLLDGMAAIRDLPGAIVQGRYDMVCPMATAHQLHRAWPAASFTVVPDAGHSAMEPGTRRALVAATDGFRYVP
ncbi:prolyl aminopeptidase Serine peptidase. MEROPS family S33 [Limimonas halophila]|uniref:Proline iminopeptidase n=1 Tax=Limimonas halophila TaxID=1082479 RepID=A0A1G7RL07_9PROT|nr:prolyl aminopeptidase [Limimonas halophila]SDG10740.1 prolyl aminopeptidase Serine peptidase. MEROPS family S33 [Limimonas halophila]